MRDSETVNLDILSALNKSKNESVSRYKLGFLSEICDNQILTHVRYLYLRNLVALMPDSQIRITEKGKEYLNLYNNLIAENMWIMNVTR